MAGRVGGKCVEQKVAKVGGWRVGAAWIAVVCRRWRPMGARVARTSRARGWPYRRAFGVWATSQSK